MGETPDQIEQQIQQARHELGENFDELQYKVKQATDWRAQFERHPWAGMAVAFAGGITLASLVGSRRAPRRSWTNPNWESNPPEALPWKQNGQHESRLSRIPAKAAETWTRTKASLMSVAAMGLKKYFEGVIPGFQDEYRKAEQDSPSFSSQAEREPIPGIDPDTLRM